MRSTRSLVLALSLCAGIAGAVAVAEPAALRAGDDPIKVREAREKFRKTQTEKGLACFHDLVYGIDKGPKDKPKLDTRWSFEPTADAAPHSQVQIRGKFSDIKLENSSIDMVVQKFKHAPEPKMVGTIKLENAGKSPKVSDKQALSQGFYEEEINSSKEVVKERCIEPQKAKGQGPAELMCSVVRVPRDGGARQRVDHYFWMGDKGSSTYILTLTFTGICESKPEAATAWANDMLKAIKELPKAPE